MTRGLLAVLFLPGVLLLAAATAEAQLPKRGMYTSHFAFHYVTKVSEIEKDHVFVTGEVIGTLLNDAGHGFLHATAVVCPLANDNVKGVSNAHGYCTVTDADGDKAFLAWKCKSPQPGARCEGDFQWTAGTGKYSGIKGNNVFHAGPVPKTASGYAVWKGEWQLPD
jgi:hypothetical protein